MTTSHQNKRRKTSNSSRSSTSEDHSEEDASSEEIIHVDCDFYDFKPTDYHGIRTFIKKLFCDDIKDLDHGELTDLIISRRSTGSTAKIDGTDDLYAFMAYIEIDEQESHPSIVALISHFMSHANDDLKAALTSHTKIGLLLSERLVNLPVKVTENLLMLLLDELNLFSGAKTEADPEHFLYISSVLEYGGKKKGKFHIREEDEVFKANAVNSLEYSCKKKDDSLGIGEWREVYLIKFTAIKDIYTCISEKYSQDCV